MDAGQKVPLQCPTYQKLWRSRGGDRDGNSLVEQYPSDHEGRTDGGTDEGRERCLGQIRDYVMTAANSVTRGQLGFYGGHLTWTL